MHHFLLTTLLLFVSTSLSADLGVSISLGQPGFYGQITLGNHFPAPRLIYPNPVLAIPSSVPMQQQPIYLHVPPGHAKKWNKHCHKYNACQLPVYFVQDDWYNNVYVPQYAHQHPQNSYRRYDDSGHTPPHGDHDKFDDRQGRGKGKQHDRDDHGGKGKKDHDRGNHRD